MPSDPQKPFLRLNEPRETRRRRSGAGASEIRTFDVATQVRSHGPVFSRLRDVLNRDDSVLELRADANSLAPERLLVFEVTGSVQNFANAVARVTGLEFAGEEELAADEFDKNPEFYLLVPQLAALKNIISLWEIWQRGERLPRNYGPWGHLFAQLRAVRPWGPSDRVSPENRDYFRHAIEGAQPAELIRVEIELVFRFNSDASRTMEAAVASHVVAIGGVIVNRSYRSEVAYHAILADVTVAELSRVVDLDPSSLAGSDPVAAIVPQSVGTPVIVADAATEEVIRAGPTKSDPIAAILDAVPVQAHPLLTQGLSIADPADLERKAVGLRFHGTAMASIVLHGDLNEPPSPISRRVYFQPVMYAPAAGDEIFENDKLVIDVVMGAVERMRAEGGEQVVVVNLSLGDRTKPFSGKISTWGRTLDYLSFRYGILFIVSAGNILDEIELADFENGAEFELAAIPNREAAIFKGLDALKADRRVLAPADSMNALTIGAWHKDASAEFFPRATPFPAYADRDMPNLSSRMGPGMRRSTKPEVLLAGGRERLRIVPGANPPRITSHYHPTKYWGLKVAAPPVNGAVGVYYTMGTSAASALATHSAHRIFDALEEAYPQLVERMPLTERAVLLKALLVHAASWRNSENFIRSIIDPDHGLHHEHWRREVCRYLGFGFVDPDDSVACMSDRATMWATGELGPEGSLTFDMPIPDALASNDSPREVRATLAWFTPIRPGRLAYRAVKLKVGSLDRASLNLAGLATTTGQPSNSQSESGTVVHRRWQASRIAECSNDVLPIQVQREVDQGIPIDENIPFGLAVTVEMPGEGRVYEQVRANIAIQPRVIIRAN